MHSSRGPCPRLPPRETSASMAESRAATSGGVEGGRWRERRCFSMFDSVAAMAVSADKAAWPPSSLASMRSTRAASWRSEHPASAASSTASPSGLTSVMGSRASSSPRAAAGRNIWRAASCVGLLPEGVAASTVASKIGSPASPTGATSFGAASPFSASPSACRCDAGGGLLSSASACSFCDAGGAILSSPVAAVSRCVR
mmetsp:Transcript_15074/g.48483  ORF Transcript_15074/g.48483 Transcript_15074/m.48483 type:complete len:200 (+) Transcript_15074:556-1155(+)